MRSSQTRLVASIKFTESTMDCLKKLARIQWIKPILLSHGIYAAVLLCCVLAGDIGFSFSLTRRTLLLRHLTHPLEIGVEQAAPLVSTTQTLEGDLFWHDGYFPRTPRTVF